VIEIHEVPILRTDQPLAEAVVELVECGFPALPVVDGRERFAGVFGERDFIRALFPGYVDQLGYAGFVGRSLEEQLERRSQCAIETVAKHMNTEHVDVHPDFSAVALAETFLHHRVAIVPVVDGGRVVGVVTRRDFFAELARRFTQT